MSTNVKRSLVIKFDWCWNFGSRNIRCLINKFNFINYSIGSIFGWNPASVLHRCCTTKTSTSRVLYSWSVRNSLINIKQSEGWLSSIWQVYGRMGFNLHWPLTLSRICLASLVHHVNPLTIVTSIDEEYAVIKVLHPWVHFPNGTSICLELVVMSDPNIHTEDPDCHSALQRPYSIPSFFACLNYCNSTLQACKTSVHSSHVYSIS